jgi:hypothetical protein
MPSYQRFPRTKLTLEVKGDEIDSAILEGSVGIIDDIPVADGRGRRKPDTLDKL